ncbi:4-diphosphocytidyl-2-C-methyl-D-erythritol kinase [Wohlfahrtiimonas chitiniclastica SH04]|uniref:4-diphosphocytidyl-2-C-methyl-D-erythritol kinase n=1 Tax=Wohlfahrtiimonas chitiniclastica SH04 TaxID=1261130 RepID=L8XYN5_9GAMM|nr:4-(cytidine 5'-diphospho)-2-C-methyl-D-erythritol kinase [Wohlfahrtiimonas chitiniclastica]ELV09007.1 4-diphosphocytidyl-2-C-methyl-D-erythritol kinase [Wohlfahrtiimonas chitiniclastica SH04]
MMHYYPAPAKINRFLRIVRQEDNGYHYLQTIFQFISLTDTLGFELRTDDQIVADYHNEFIHEGNDLIVKAIRLLQAKSGRTTGVTITLDKHIPMGAGLGGGSSNAATALMAINELYGLHYSSETLQALGRTLGADVPIFIYGQSAWAEGIGDQFIPMMPEESEQYLIVPPIAISTQKVFQSEHLARNHPMLPQSPDQPYLNDCISAIVALYPQMGHYLTQLTNIGVMPKITGTGACIYIDVPTESQMARLMDLANLEGWQVLPFKTLNRSPFHA